MHAATCKWASYLGSGVTPDPMSSALLVLPRYTSWRKHSQGDMSNVWEASLKFAGYIDSYRGIDETALFLFLYQTRGHSHRWWERPVVRSVNINFCTPRPLIPSDISFCTEIQLHHNTVTQFPLIFSPAYVVARKWIKHYVWAIYRVATIPLFWIITQFPQSVWLRDDFR